jgi:Ca2+-binding RTX toxin-like protein
VLICSPLFATPFLVVMSPLAVLVLPGGLEAAAAAVSAALGAGWLAGFHHAGRGRRGGVTRAPAAARPPVRGPDRAVGRRMSLPLLGRASCGLIALAMVPGAASAAPSITLDTPVVGGNAVSLSASLTSNGSCGANPSVFRAGCPANYTFTGPFGFSGTNLWWNDSPGTQPIQQDFDMSGYPAGTYTVTLVAIDSGGTTYVSNAQQFQWSAGGIVHHDAASGATTLTDGPGAARVRMSAGACTRGFGSARCARFTTAGDALTPSGGCRAEAADAVVCPLADTYRIRLGGGNDRLAFASGGAAVAYKRLVVSGGPGSDSIVGGPGDDRLVGNGGRDRVIGDDPGCNWGDTHNCGGEDVVSGGPGDDVIDGSRAGDRLSGGPGDDRIAGDEPGCDPIIDPRCGGEDRVSGGPGKDVISGGPAADRISGGAGADRLDGDDSGCTPFDPRCGGTDVVSGGPDDDIIVGGPADDRISGGNGADRIAGDHPSCTITDPRCGGDDVVSAGPGDDTIFSGPGNDRISGGPGQNRIAADSTDCTPFDPRC